MTAYTTHRVRSQDGTTLVVHETGNPDGLPVLFVHAFAQSGRAWDRVLGSDLAADHRLLALDLRGHGESDRPAALDAYTEPQRWAEDLDAVVTTLGLQRLTLVAWSVGGVVTLNYLARFGTAAVARLNLVGAANKLGTPEAFGFFGATALTQAERLSSTDLATNIDAMIAVNRAITKDPLPWQEWGAVMSYSAIVPIVARAGLFGMAADHDETLRRFDRPVLLSHADTDTIVTIAAAEHARGLLADARLSVYTGGGHAPFLDDTPRFVAELRAFIGATA